MGNGYVVLLSDGVWLAEGNGYPPRTLVARNAKLFATMQGARAALTRARKYHPFATAEIIEVRR